MSLISKIKQIFSPSYGIGSLRSPIDNRNIPISSVQKPEDIPNEYKFINGNNLDQGPKPRCVGFGIGRGVSDLIGVELSPDDLYEQCKKEDGIPYQDGTYISVGVKIATNNGICSQKEYDNGDEINKEIDRNLYKINGYAWVTADFEEICQTIYQKKFVICGLEINSKWYNGIITRVLKSVGGHCVILNGYVYDKGILKGRNSWGKSWVGKIAGILNHSIADGEFEMLWNDYSDKIYDIVALTYIPPEIKKETEYTYRFMNTLRYGSSGYDVKKLQELLKINTDGQFGIETRLIFQNWQTKNKLIPDGIFGHDSRIIMNKTAKSLIENWALAIQSHEGYLNPKQYPPSGSRSYRNNNPANFKPGSLTTFIKNLGATSIDSGGFAIFPSYEIGFNALKTFLKMACQDKLPQYKSSMTLKQFYSVYAPSSDGNNVDVYAKFIANKLGCSIDTKIDELL